MRGSCCCVGPSSGFEAGKREARSSSNDRRKGNGAERELLKSEFDLKAGSDSNKQRKKEKTIRVCAKASPLFVRVVAGMSLPHFHVFFASQPGGGFEWLEVKKMGPRLLRTTMLLLLAYTRLFVRPFQRMSSLWGINKQQKKKEFVFAFFSFLGYLKKKRVLNIVEKASVGILPVVCLIRKARKHK
uniref:WGS project CAEQ00000000 data, annotated contig 243 n=1 Tax=Trypanosoma congolense (strain IL3000) TaxID=1068625 RepID=F9WE37_TRYCI|nr:unnamed protein product [Trypanosoma congolense IL3000]